MNMTLATQQTNKSQDNIMNRTLATTNQQKLRQYYEHYTSYYKPTKAEIIIRTGHKQLNKPTKAETIL